MATKLNKFDFSAPSAITSSEKAVYPWEDWLDGDIWELRHGDTEGADFETHPLMMERIIRTRATARGAKVRLRHLPLNGDAPFGIIVVQRTDIEGPNAQKRAATAEKKAAKKAAAKSAAEAFVKEKGLKPVNGKRPPAKKALSKRPARQVAAAAK